MATRAPAAVETTRKELFLVIARAFADGHARVPTGRFADLAAQVAATDEQWLSRLIGWTHRHDTLRHLRLAAVAELAQARLVAGAAGRADVDEALRRSDEPGELLSYWISRYGRAIPKPVKRGVADAVLRLYDEHALATYDSPSATLRFADVLALTHPSPRTATQAAVFQHAVARRRGNVNQIDDALPLLHARRALYWINAAKRPELLCRPDAREVLGKAAMTWQTVHRWLLGTMTGPAWTAVVPTMSYRDMLDNLPSFDQTKVSDEVAAHVASELMKPAAVIRAGVTPLEIAAAMRAVPGSRWTWALREAMELSLANVPSLPGRTLVVVDRQDAAAAVFATAISRRSPSADVVHESSADVVRRRPEQLSGYDRIVILTEQDRAAEAAEAITVPGHEHIITDVNSGWFQAIPHIEMARNADWPF